MELLQGGIHLFFIELSFFCQTDVPTYLFKELYPTQVIFQIVDGAAEGRLGDAQSCGGHGIVLYLGQNGEVTQNIVVHGWGSFIYSLIL